MPSWGLAGSLEGPGSVEQTLVGNDGITNPQYRSWFLTSTLRPWNDFKAQLKKDYGLDPGIDYSVFGQISTSNLGNGHAAGHDARFYGTWTPVDPGGSNSGGLTFKVESRENYGGVPPTQLGFDSGAAAFTTQSFSNAGWVLTNLYWKQHLFDGRLTIGAGQIDVTDFVDFYALAVPVKAFQNLVFSGSPAIGAPSQGLAAAAGFWLSDQVYVTSSVADANGDPHNPTRSADRFFDNGESFQHVEVGYTSARDRLFLDNVHLTYWHVSERENAGVPEGWGLSMSASWTIDNAWMPFLRAGYANRGGALYDRSVSIGIGYLTQERDLFGLGLNWGRPEGFSSQQGTLETFYRYQVSEAFAVTVNAQLIANPALNPDRDVIGFFGLRTRLAF